MSPCFCGVGSLLRSLCASRSSPDTDPCCMLEPTEKISGELHESLDYFTRHDLRAGSIERRLFFLKMLEINSKMNLRYGRNKDREAP